MSYTKEVFQRTLGVAPAIPRRKSRVRRWGAIAAPALAAICVSATSPQAAIAASCKAHFEIRHGSFKPDVPAPHFEAHQERRKGETDNQTRRRAREAAQACMSALWRDRFKLQNGDPSAAPECRIRLGESTVIRPLSVSRIDLKRALERAACGDKNSNMDTARNATAKIYKRTYGGRGCGPNLQTVESRFLTDYTFDCQAIRAREGWPVTKTKVNEDENWDRPGMDIRSFPASSQQKCMKACDEERKCRAWTWVKPGIQGPGGRCWLKNGVPWAKRNNCCVSGVMR